MDQKENNINDQLLDVSSIDLDDSALPRRMIRRLSLKSRIAIASGLLIMLVSAFALWPGKKTDTTAAISFYTVKPADLTVTVQASGSVRASDAIDIKSEVEGRATVISIVAEGTYITPQDVAEGRVLVELDSSELKEKITQQEIQIASSEASLTDANEDYSIQRKQNESDINAGEMKARFSLLDLQKYLGETVAQELIDNQARRSLKLVDFDQAQLVFQPMTTSELLDIAVLKKLIIEVKGDQPDGFEFADYAEDPALGGEALQKKRTLEAKISLAAEEFNRARNQLEWTQKLYDKEFVSRGDLEADQLASKRKSIELDQARTELDLFLRYEFPKEAQRLLAAWVEAQMQLDRVYASARSKLAQALAKLKSAEASFYYQRERLAKLYRQLNACVIRAPGPGMVVYSSSGDPWRNRDPIEPGSTVHERQVILSLPNTAEMSVEMKVHESSVDKIKPDQKARITIDAFPDIALSGKVLKIAPLPDQTRAWLNPDLKVYSTQVSIDGTNTFLKPGMSAKVEVTVEKLAAVLAVPIQSIINQSGSRFCYVQNGDKLQLRPVETGSFTDSMIQVTSGIAAGEKVALNPPRLLEGAEIPIKKVKAQPLSAKPAQKDKKKKPAADKAKTGASQPQASPVSTKPAGAQ